MSHRTEEQMEAARMRAWQDVRREYAERQRLRAERMERGEPVGPPELDPYLDDVPPPEVRHAIERRRRTR